MKKRVLFGLIIIIIGLFFLSACVPKCPEGQVFVDGSCTDIKIEEEYEEVEEKVPEVKESAIIEVEEVKEEPKQIS